MGADQGYLTTHILDTSNGCPAKGVRITLFRLEDGTRAPLVQMTTNDDGRTDTPILPKGSLTAGTYELVFEIGDYFRELGQADEIAFVDVVPIRFGIADASEHYHVPLLASPFSFSTYRGS